MKIIPFEANVDTMLKRFYLMMAVAIVGGFTGQIWMMFLALPLFLSAMLGLKVEMQPAAKEVNMEQVFNKNNMKAAR